MAVTPATAVATMSQLPEQPPLADITPVPSELTNSLRTRDKQADWSWFFMAVKMDTTNRWLYNATATTTLLPDQAFTPVPIVPDLQYYLAATDVLNATNLDTGSGTTMKPDCTGNPVFLSADDVASEALDLRGGGGVTISLHMYNFFSSAYSQSVSDTPPLISPPTPPELSPIAHEFH
ncbi:hypothetical protein J3A83DRAFT_4367315 [Scleroderma citrinum]